MAGVWLRILLRDLARFPREVAGRFAMVAAAALVLAAFSFVLPAYRASFTAAIEHARFDVDLAACECTVADSGRIRALPGVERILPVLGIGGLSLSAGDTKAGAWAWVIDDTANADLLPLSPDYLITGRYDLGTVAQPMTVLDLELARQLGTGVGDIIEAQFQNRTLKLTVSGVSGPAARFRGPTLVLLRGLVTPLIPPNSPLIAAPFTEVFIQGSVSAATVAGLFPTGTTAVYTKRDQIAAQEAQIEVSQPVIEVVSILAAFGLLAVLAFAGWQAMDRRMALLSLLPHFGSGFGTGLVAVVILEGMPTALAAAAGALLGMIVIANGYFAGVGAFVSVASAAVAAGAVGGAGLLIQTAIYAAWGPRLGRR